MQPGQTAIIRDLQALLAKQQRARKLNQAPFKSSWQDDIIVIWSQTYLLFGTRAHRLGADRRGAYLQPCSFCLA
jgi:hypothetical protein